MKDIAIKNSQAQLINPTKICSDMYLEDHRPRRCSSSWWTSITPRRVPPVTRIPTTQGHEITLISICTQAQQVIAPSHMVQ